MRLRALILAVLLPLAASDAPKKNNPNKVADFAEIENRIYKTEMLENFEERAVSEIFRMTALGAKISLKRELVPPVSESAQYLSIQVEAPETQRVRLEFINPPEIKKRCRAIKFWLSVEKLHAKLSLIVEDREGRRHFLDSGDLQFRGWREIRLPIHPRVRQHDYYLKEESALKVIAVEIVFSAKYAKGVLPLILIDEIAAEIRDKYQEPPALKK